MATDQSKQHGSRSRRPNIETVEYEDDLGFKYLVDVPVGRHDLASIGVRIGPPDLSSLDLTDTVKRALNHQLFNRGIITERDARMHPNEVASAVQAALKVSTTSILNLYLTGGSNGQ